ncbi:hypothetical protein HaLaN_13578 [Haematococcus lacustris]|uniref:Uncharacterized protein n=1 Tax=Haematococcus lacustris TaxID=44745 RepID=A0A699Z4N1_HAELA|nr:hypothetical protein HaLaN_13578 [Haematococcus lacustris]
MVLSRTDFRGTKVAGRMRRRRRMKGVAGDCSLRPALTPALLWLGHTGEAGWQDGPADAALLWCPMYCKATRAGDVYW